MSTHTAFAAFAVCIGCSAFAGIAYDGISNSLLPTQFYSISGPWQAKDLTLDTDNLALDHIDVLTRMSSSSSLQTFSGSLRIALYTSVPYYNLTMPGTLLGSRLIQHNWTRAVSEVVTADFTGLVLPSNQIWIGWVFANASGFEYLDPINSPFIVPSLNNPVVGSTTDLYSAGPSINGPWQQSRGFLPESIRVVTLPSPAGVCVVALAICRGCNRRRRI